LRHLIARLSARGAYLSAVRQLLISGNRTTGLFARSAELGARGAGYDVIRRAPQHEVGARLTYLGAVQQDATEVHLGVFPASRDAVLQRHRAHGVAVQALLDTLLHGVVRVLMGLVALEIDAIVPLALGH